MLLASSQSAGRESRLLARSLEAGNVVLESRESARRGVLGNTRADLAKFVRHLVSLDVPGAAIDAMHTPFSLVQDIGFGVAKTVDRANPLSK